MKILRVNMTEKKIVNEPADDTYNELGGRGLTAAIISKEVPPTCDPLGPQNKLVVAGGLLTGTTFVNTSRISIGGKSPLTGGIKESNAGGTIGAVIGKMGIKAVIVEGAPASDDLYILKIQKDGAADLLPAAELKGLRTYALMEKLTAKYGDKIAVLCIGPAGEYKLASASVQSSDVDGRPCRAAGRGGLGAVMGSKGLKAIVVEMGGRVDPVIADPAAFKEATAAYVKAVKNDPSSGGMLPNLGTAGLVAPVNSVGAFPSYNATKGTLEGWEKISGEALAETIKARGGNPTHLGCSQCIVHCSNVYVDEKGGYVTSSLEYETIWSMGGMLGVDDLDAIAKLDFLCDDIGVDTMNTGVAIAVAMDAGYKSFGDSNAAIALMEEIAKGSEIGKLIGNGPAAVGKHFKHARVAVVKNQSIAAYDPRAMPANGVTYATSPMGADHTAGNLVGEYLMGKLDAKSKEGHVQASLGIQPVMAFVDCTGVCLFATFALASPEGGGAFFKAMGAKLGRPFGPEDMIAMGVNCIKTEKEFNRKAGLTSADDRLPEFFKTEPLGPNNYVFQISDAELDAAQE
jgi:aldehyde:ferredoxin oxidoreductase